MALLDYLRCLPGGARARSFVLVVPLASALIGTVRAGEEGDGATSAQQFHHVCTWPSEASPDEGVISDLEGKSLALSLPALPIPVIDPGGASGPSDGHTTESRGMLGPHPFARRELGSASDDRPYWHINLFRRVLSDQPFLVTKWWPMEFHRTGFATPLLAGVFSAATSSWEATSVDQSIERHTDQTTQGGYRTVAHGLTKLGNAPTGAVLLGTTYLVGRFSHNERLSETTSLSAEAILDAGIWVTALKAVSARTRPSSGGQGEFFQYNTKNGQENGSFPSGHAMGAFALATVFAHQYEDKPWVRWVSYGTATLIGVSRVALGRHYPSDVLVGAVLGNSVGRMVIARAREGRTLPDWSLQPIVSPGNKGWGLAYSRAW